ncbi:hypothetical protein [Chromobacterium violaceum]|uniref:hypothetical protein n=1 Tax=Chromobacterium violaceum TaxID=536 RepID=UPI000C124DDE|nr:hypothetical protein [Chromobacterium violaceum]ATP28799.1 hypothetical protein CRN81_10520 [Chromobacterium violaceum]
MRAHREFESHRFRQSQKPRCTIWAFSIPPCWLLSLALLSERYLSPFSAISVIYRQNKDERTRTGKDALNAVRNNPTLAFQLQQEIDSNKVPLAQISQATALAEIWADTTDTVAVNATMQAEARAEHWPTYSWRPFIG